MPLDQTANCILLRGGHASQVRRKSLGPSLGQGYEGGKAPQAGCNCTSRRLDVETFWHVSACKKAWPHCSTISTMATLPYPTCKSARPPLRCLLSTQQIRGSIVVSISAVTRKTRVQFPAAEYSSLLRCWQSHHHAINIYHHPGKDLSLTPSASLLAYKRHRMLQPQVACVVACPMPILPWLLRFLCPTLVFTCVPPLFLVFLLGVRAL